MTLTTSILCHCDIANSIIRDCFRLPWLSSSTKNWTHERFYSKKTALKATVVIAVGTGCILSLDKLLFGHISQISQTYNNKPSLASWVSSITYGGVVEEIMMRLFIMSLLSWIVWKLFFRNSKTIPNKLLIVSNILTALLFATGHLPATILIFGALTPLLVFRCFFLNGIGYWIWNYYQQISYICPLCKETFKPNFKTFFFARHTPRTRKLTCPHCHQTNYCIEVVEER
ncbi:CPBP family glutamic-type intramembrane protease [Streptococcus caprae]|uniref:Type II CAAX prenyl endopeptidase Rce1 family protein n=1 Tax=Streptococcus caprae TaxID=1640501 RepID=A0ABV8CT36_9STRE